MAYGAKGERNGVHREGMHQHGFWCEDVVWQNINLLADGFGLSFTEFLKALANGDLYVYKSANEDG